MHPLVYVDITVRFQVYGGILGGSHSTHEQVQTSTYQLPNALTAASTSGSHSPQADAADASAASARAVPNGPLIAAAAASSCFAVGAAPAAAPAAADMPLRLRAPAEAAAAAGSRSARRTGRKNMANGWLWLVVRIPSCRLPICSVAAPAAVKSIRSGTTTTVTGTVNSTGSASDVAAPVWSFSAPEEAATAVAAPATGGAGM